MDYKIKEETLTGIAEAIRSKTGKTEEILAADFAGNINSIDTSKPEETKEVLLDFSGGDMEVVPTTGNVLSKVTIPQPENLLPENIAEGIDIAGIIGTLAAGGSANLRVATGFSQTQADTITITHNLGVVPDIFIVSGGGTPTQYLMVSAWAVSSAFIGATGITTKGTVCFYYDSSRLLSHTTSALDGTTGVINSATETTVVVGKSNYKALGSYSWVAIGGLT